MEHLATPEQVSARIGEPIESAEEIALAEAVLMEASAWVRHYGGQMWAVSNLAPGVAVAITAAAASRGYLNPAGYDMERSDMSTFNRIAEYAAGTQLTKAEIAMLKPFNRQGGVVSVGAVNDSRPRPNHGRRNWNRGYAPMADGTKPFPLGVEETCP